MRLNKYIAQAGLASRRKADEMIAGGKVRINGAVVREMGVDVHDPYRRVDTTQAVVIAGSYAEKFCKEREIPYTVKR